MRAWQTAPVSQPGESHGQRSLAGFSLQHHKVGQDCNDLAHTHTCPVFTMKDRICSSPWNTFPGGEHQGHNWQIDNIGPSGFKQIYAYLGLALHIQQLKPIQLILQRTESKNVMQVGTLWCISSDQATHFIAYSVQLYHSQWTNHIPCHPQISGLIGNWNRRVKICY